MRTEQQIFDELAALCASPGFAHAIAFFCLRDNIVGYADELKGEDYAKLFSPERLIRTEISTLIGLMARVPIDYALPSQSEIAEFLERAEALLKEIHHAMLQPFNAALQGALKESRANPFATAEALREPIFYGGESAYTFQYRDLASKKYERDRDWLRQHKGFAIADAEQVVRGVLKHQEERLIAALRALRGVTEEAWTVLDGFTFLAADIAAITGQPLDLVTKVLSAFTLVTGNSSFTSLHEFNGTNAYPLLKLPDGRYLLFQYAALTEAIYDTPFYWMSADRGYAPTAMTNRGRFTEEFAADRLERVFGKAHVYRNVDVWRSKSEKLGEIDTLVLFANRAIVLQAKSKKLTLDARKGNDLQLKADFKAAVQNACDQAYLCSQQIATKTARLTDVTGQEIRLPNSIAAIHPICVVAEHYPALSFQSRQFLKHSASGVIKAPLVCDVFLLDTMSELLESPLRLLSYLELRALAGDNISLSHENVALAYHLKRNLWLGEYDMIHLADDISADLDIAMAARRDGVDGKKTPPGILTELRDLSLGRIVAQLETRSDAAAVEIGLELLKISGEAASDISRGIDKIVSLSAKDNKAHDATFGFSKAALGLTIHCNAFPDSVAAPKLRTHCTLRKHSQKATKWLGLIVAPGTGQPRLGLVLDYPWAPNEDLDKVIARMPSGVPPKALRHVDRGLARPGKKLGKYQRCPCGSMIKYIKCCLRRRQK